MKNTNKITNVVGWVCRIGAALILLQTLYFKFTAAPESVYIFTKVGMEPWGRWGTGCAELVASILLFIRCKAWMGAFMAIGIMSGAIVSHLTVLGIVVQNDGGLLFGLALTVMAFSLVTLYLERAHYLRWLPTSLAKAVGH